MVWQCDASGIWPLFPSLCLKNEKVLYFFVIGVENYNHQQTHVKPVR